MADMYAICFKGGDFVFFSNSFQPFELSQH